jgi:hypothetical protein
MRQHMTQLRPVATQARKTLGEFWYRLVPWRWPTAGLSSVASSAKHAVTMSTSPSSSAHA